MTDTRLLTLGRPSVEERGHAQESRSTIDSVLSIKATVSQSGEHAGASDADRTMQPPVYVPAPIPTEHTRSAQIESAPRPVALADSRHDPRIKLTAAPPSRGIEITLTLQEAAAFLKLHPEELRRRAKAGQIPGAKVGRAWVFLQQDLADFVRSLYAQPRQALRVTLRKEIETCHFADATASTGSTFAHPQESEYADLLGLPTKPKRKSFTTG